MKMSDDGLFLSTKIGARRCRWSVQEGDLLKTKAYGLLGKVEVMLWLTMITGEKS